MSHFRKGLHAACHTNTDGRCNPRIDLDFPYLVKEGKLPIDGIDKTFPVDAYKIEIFRILKRITVDFFRPGVDGLRDGNHQACPVTFIEAL